MNEEERLAARAAELEEKMRRLEAEIAAEREWDTAVLLGRAQSVNKENDKRKADRVVRRIRALLEPLPVMATPEGLRAMLGAKIYLDLTVKILKDFSEREQ